MGSWVSYWFIAFVVLLLVSIIGFIVCQLMHICITRDRIVDDHSRRKNPSSRKRRWPPPAASFSRPCSPSASLTRRTGRHSIGGATRIRIPFRR